MLRGKYIGDETMSDKLNVVIKAEAKGVDGDFGARMTIEYDNMGRSTFATLESSLMGMFKGLADSQIQVTESPNTGVIR